MARFLTSNPQRFLVWSDKFIWTKAVLEEQGCYAAEIGFAELCRPSCKCVGILGEDDRALFDVRLREDFEVVADDMSIRRRFMTAQSCDMGSRRYPAAADRASVVIAIATSHTHPDQPMNPETTKPHLQTRLENLLSLVCKGVLILIPVLFAVAHIAANGELWNFATGETFNPIYNVVSSYAWRSPAGWAMVACMVGFAVVMGFVSWHAAKREPGFLAWFTAVVAAIAMVKMLEVAWYSFKPSREMFSQIQTEMDQMPTREMKLEMWNGGLYAVGLPLPEGIASPQYFKSLRSSWIHQHGIGGAQVLIILAIMGSRFLWESRRPDHRFWRSFWFWAQWVVLLLVAGGIFGRLWFPDLNGVTQRVVYLGIYLWMLVIVREIELERRPKASDVSILPEDAPSQVATTI